MNRLIDIAVVLGTIGLLWMLWQSRYQHVIHIRGGKPHCVKGIASARFLEDLEELCRREGVSRGTIKGLRRGRGVRLVFSRGIPRSCRQPMQNIWHLHN